MAGRCSSNVGALLFSEKTDNYSHTRHSHASLVWRNLQRLTILQYIPIRSALVFLLISIAKVLADSIGYGSISSSGSFFKPACSLSWLTSVGVILYFWKVEAFGMAPGSDLWLEKLPVFRWFQEIRMKSFFLEHRRGALTELLMCWRLTGIGEDVSRFRERKKLLLYDPANHSARLHFLAESLNRRTENDSGNAERQMWNCNEQKR